MSWPMVKLTVIYRNYSYYSHYKEKPAKIIWVVIETVFTSSHSEQRS